MATRSDKTGDIITRARFFVIDADQIEYDSFMTLVWHTNPSGRMTRGDLLSTFETVESDQVTFRANCARDDKSACGLLGFDLLGSRVFLAQLLHALLIGPDDFGLLADVIPQAKERRPDENPVDHDRLLRMVCAFRWR